MRCRAPAVLWASVDMSSGEVQVRRALGVRDSSLHGFTRAASFHFIGVVLVFDRLILHAHFTYA